MDFELILKHLKFFFDTCRTIKKDALVENEEIQQFFIEIKRFY